MWLKVYCLLCGFKHKIVRQTSERFQMYVRKNFAALVLLMILWYLTGYLFAANHLDLDANYLLHFAGFIMMVFVVIVERQILLSDINIKRSLVRFGIGLVMAFLGSFVVDQALFAKDIEALKNDDPEFKIRKEKSKSTQIKRIQGNIKFLMEKNKADSSRLTKILKSNQYNNLSKVEFDVQIIDDSIQSVPKRQSTTPVLNKQRIIEKGELEASIDSTEKKILDLRLDEEAIKLEAHEEAIQNSGFLEDLVYFQKFLWEKENRLALLFYLLVFLFLLFLELLILSNKWGYKATDYDALLKYQEKVITDQYTKS